MNVLRILESHGQAMSIGAFRQATGKARIENLIKDHGLVRTGDTIHAPTLDPHILCAVQFRATVTCVSALRLHGLRVDRRDLDITHLRVPKTRHCKRSKNMRLEKVHIHRRGAEVDRRVDTALDALMVAIKCYLRQERWLDAVAICDAAIQSGKVSYEELEACVYQENERRVIKIFQLVNGKARSWLETKVRMDLLRAGFEPEVGVQIEGVGEVDLLIQPNIIIELDGREFHDTDDAFTKDRWRSREAFYRGFITLRFTFADAQRPGPPWHPIESAHEQNSPQEDKWLPLISVNFAHNALSPDACALKN
ncbi:MAG: hypothetical protein Q4G30_05325 [Actinomycetaceae bacterium]|nr:hypothetical protein [Actinomycetaceae bacterium]